ncbi:MAG: hypothetical protein M1826_001203 [Phylliscum demangeonii]|nr:MAG: hypothetical protein M1826_001203 [Phylliscum demangeonii]
MAARSNGHVVPLKGNVKAFRRNRQFKSHATGGGFVGRGLSIIARLAAWYAILTILLRCPSSPADLTESSPRVCEPYLAARSYVYPRLQPYYNSYAAPYVDTVRPYVANVESKVVRPVVKGGRRVYERYGALRVDQMRQYGEREWERTLRPRLDVVAAKAGEQYNATVAPHVARAARAASPYYGVARDSFLQTYYAHVLPTYTTSLPYAQRAYLAGQSFVLDIGLPYTNSALSSASALISRTIWPRVRILYGENVEPQLVRIGERLARYRDKKKLEAAVHEVDQSIRASSTLSAVSSVLSSISATASASISIQPSEADKAPENPTEQRPLTEDEQVEQARETVENDLKVWREKFAKASKKGADELAQRVEAIGKKQIARQVDGVGQALLIELEESIHSGVEGAKTRIIAAAQSLSRDADATEQEKAVGGIRASIKAAGLVSKGKAQAIRTWKQKFNEETLSLVVAATESTLAVIDNIRDLGLQEIGMRWAWMDGVTYHDWAKYHELRRTFDDWRKEVENSAWQSETLIRASSAADDLEEKAMSLAEEAATELSRLKDVGRWKVEARDASDDFSTRSLPPVAMRAGQAVMEKVNGAADVLRNDVPAAAASPVSAAASGVKNAASSVSSYVTPSEPGLVEKASSALSESIVGPPQSFIKKVDSSASAAVSGTVSPAAEVVRSRAADNVKAASSAISEAVGADGSLPSAKTGLSDTASSGKDAAVSVASTASTKVWGGASAEAVHRQQGPILDDVVVEDSEGTAFSEKLQSMVNHAGENLSDLTRAVQEAIRGTPTSQGALESATSLASEQYSKALSAASIAFYGTHHSGSQSVVSVASKRYADAVSAASSVIYGTPTPTLSAVVAAASSQFFFAISKAQEQYLHAKSIVSSQIHGESTSKPVHEQMFSSIEAAYSGSVAAANANLQSALSAVSTGIYGTSLGPMQSVSSVASRKLAEAASAASSQYEQAKSAITGSPTPTAKSLLSAADKKYSDLLSGASAQYSSALTAASTAYYGASQGPLDSISSIASSRLSAGLSAASASYASAKEALLSQPTPSPQSFAVNAQRRYYEAVGLAHDRYSAFVDSASAAVYGTPTPTHQGLYHAASKAVYGTAVPAYQTAMAAADSQYSSAVDAASSRLAEMVDHASATTKGSSPSKVLQAASSRYSAALAAASSSLSSASSVASSAIDGTRTSSPPDFIHSIASAISQNVGSAASGASSQLIGSETPWTESVASAASQNWEHLVSKASEQVYGGAPTPFTESVMSRAGEYVAQASDGATARYDAMRSLVSELVVGREPDFTESVMSRFNSAIYTGAPAMASSVSSLASDAYESASSVVAAVFTPPPAIEAILDAANRQISSVVDAASVQVYGTSKGAYEQATSAAANAYSSAQSRVSSAIHGTSTGYAEAAQSQISAAAASAQSAISAAIYGPAATATASGGSVERLSGAAKDNYSAVSKAVSENLSAAGSAAAGQYAAASAKASQALYGPGPGPGLEQEQEQEAVVQSAQGRLSAAVESARARLAELMESAGDSAKEAVASIKESVENLADSAGSALRPEDAASEQTTTTIILLPSSSASRKDEL